MKQEKIKIHLIKGKEIVKKATIEETDNGGVLVSTDISKRGYNSITEAVTELITDCWR